MLLVPLSAARPARRELLQLDEDEFQFDGDDNEPIPVSLRPKRSRNGRPDWLIEESDDDDPVLRPPPSNRPCRGELPEPSRPRPLPRPAWNTRKATGVNEKDKTNANKHSPGPPVPGEIPRFCG